MAFHNPNPQLRAIEEQNERLRARFFRALFRSLLRRSARGVAYLLRTVFGPRRLCGEAPRRSCGDPA